MDTTTFVASAAPAAIAPVDARLHAWAWVDLREEVRRAARIYLVFGALSGLLCLTPPHNAGTVVLGAIAGLLLVAGLWQLAAPSAMGLVSGGICLLVIGLTNIIDVLGDMARGDRPSWFWLVFGLWQVHLGIGGFRRFPAAREVHATKPPDDDLRRWATALRRELRFGSPARRPALVTLGMKTGGRQRLIRMRLEEAEALVLGTSADQLAIVPRDEVRMTLTKKAATMAMAEANLRLGALEGTAYLDARASDRLTSWLAGPAFEL